METKTKPTGLESRVKYDSTNISDPNFNNVFEVKSIVERVEAGVKNIDGVYTEFFNDKEDFSTLTIRKFLTDYIQNADPNKVSEENSTIVASLRGILSQKEISYTLPCGRPLNDRDLDRYLVKDYVVPNTERHYNAFRMIVKNTQGGGLEVVLG